MWIGAEGGKERRREVVDRRGRREGEKEIRREVVDRRGRREEKKERSCG